MPQGAAEPDAQQDSPQGTDAATAELTSAKQTTLCYMSCDQLGETARDLRRSFKAAVCKHVVCQAAIDTAAVALQKITDRKMSAGWQQRPLCRGSCWHGQHDLEKQCSAG